MKNRLTLKSLKIEIDNLIHDITDIKEHQRSHKNKINEIISKMIDWENACKALDHQMYQIELDILNNRHITECCTCHCKVTEMTAKREWNNVVIDPDCRTFDIVDKSYNGYKLLVPICPECEKEGEIAIYKMLFEKDDK